MLVLAARPLAQWGWPRLFLYRRMLGLFVFFYVSLHLLVFAQVYVGWRGDILLEELVERPYVMVGFAAWLLLLPLAVTSTHAMRRRTGQALEATAPGDLCHRAAGDPAPAVAVTLRHW